MAIPQSRYIKVKNILKETRTVSRRDLSGLVLTTNALAPFGYVLEFGTAEDVRTYFGRTAKEYGFAVAYFAVAGYDGKKPERLSFTRYTRGLDSALKPEMVSQSCSIELDDFRKPIGGDTSVVINTTVYDSETLTLKLRKGSAQDTNGLLDCVCLSDICEVYNEAACAAANPDWLRTSVMSFENGRFYLRFPDLNEGELLPFGDTALAQAFGFTEKSQVIVSDGGGDFNGRVGAISRVARNYDDFGSFCFLDGDDEIVRWTGTAAESFWSARLREIVAVDKWLSDENYRFMYVSGFSRDYHQMLVDAGIGYSTHHVLFDALRYGCEESEAMGIFSTIDYGSEYEAQYSWMFRSNERLTPLASSDAVSAEYTRQALNYYGLTQEVGAERAFYQPGKNADGSDTSVVCAEIWLKDALQTAIINCFLEHEKLSMYENGVEILGIVMTEVIDEALSNGMITIPTGLTNVQKIYINQAFGSDEGASVEVEKDGYCLSFDMKDESTVDYRLMYHKNGNFRVIEGTHIA